MAPSDSRSVNRCGQGHLACKFPINVTVPFLDIPKGQCEPGIEPDRVADDFRREAVALKRYRSHPMMLIGDEPQSHPSYRDIASSCPQRKH